MKKAFLPAIAVAACLSVLACEDVADYRIDGVVLDAATGRPVAGAVVHEGAYAASLSAGATTDAEGRFSYLTYPEEHNVIVEAGGYAKWKATVCTGSGKSESLTVRLTAAE